MATSPNNASSERATPSTPPRSTRKQLHLSPFSSPKLNTRNVDRFIPTRDLQDAEVSAWLLRKETHGRTPPDANDATDRSNRDQRYQHEVAARLLDGGDRRTGGVRAVGRHGGAAGGGGSPGGGGGSAGGGGGGGAGKGPGGLGSTPRVLNFGSPNASPAKPPNSGSAAHDSINALHSKLSSNDSMKRKPKRAIPTAPERVLDAVRGGVVGSGAGGGGAAVCRGCSGW
jgi:hypothetical protein